eukprot:CAMPEP_0173307374 /NCGR_PEP_ID=MMETSP1143-20121109/21120_1 /TAXON_ID=483371 /ORGANISM="non described non described, Strain CCMP2298" /LENGTH=115 /DNA_ID=CAMNT_0014248609 /DNA_START=118 /DNA_END=465 /DNA_ORIENTATION=-
MSAPPPTPAQQEAYMTQLRQQVQTQMMQELMNKMTEKCFKVILFINSCTTSHPCPAGGIHDPASPAAEKCFKVCTGKKGEHLDSSESQCVVHCMDRYMETMQVVNQSLVSRGNAK